MGSVPVAFPLNPKKGFHPKDTPYGRPGPLKQVERKLFVVDPMLTSGFIGEASPTGTAL